MAGPWSAVWWPVASQCWVMTCLLISPHVSVPRIQGSQVVIYLECRDRGSNLFNLRIYHTVNRLGSFLSHGHLVTWSLDHSVTWSLRHSVTWSLSHSVTRSLFSTLLRTDWLTDTQHQDLQVCFADNNTNCENKCLLTTNTMEIIYFSDNNELISIYKTQQWKAHVRKT